MRTLPLLALLVLGACSTPDPAPGPTPSAPPPTPAPSGVAVSAGAVTLEVTAPATADRPGVQTSPDTGTATVTLRPGSPAGETPGGTADPQDATAPEAAPEIALTSPGTFATHPDGSVTVLDGDTPVGGLTPPQGARLVAADETHLEVRATGDEPSDEPGGEVTTILGTTGVASTAWGEREGGRSLAVDATGWAREAGRAGVDVVWAELVAADPEVDTATMRDQLECHAIGAPDKATWNLEPWRPDVGLLATMAARCNPTP